MAKYHVYTDGSSRGNPGPGGWGLIAMNEDETEIIFTEHDTEDHTTNNRMELTAILCALGFAESHPNDTIIIFSDSAYAVNSCNTWMRGWAANGWRNSKKVTVENVDLMKALYSYLSRDFFNAEIRKCAGHAGAIGNELADAIATSNTKRYEELVDYWGIVDKELEEYKNITELRGSSLDWFPID